MPWPLVDVAHIMQMRLQKNNRRAATLLSRPAKKFGLKRTPLVITQYVERMQVDLIDLADQRPQGGNPKLATPTHYHFYRRDLKLMETLGLHTNNTALILHNL